MTSAASLNARAVETRIAAGAIIESEAERGALLFLLQDFDFALVVVHRDVRDAALDARRQHALIGRRRIHRRAEQIVEQQRMRDHAFGEQRAVGEQFDDASARNRLFFEQHQISRPAQHRLHETQQPFQRGGRRDGRGRCRDQPRHEPIEMRFRFTGQRSRSGRRDERGELCVQRIGIVETECRRVPPLAIRRPADVARSRRPC